MVNHWYIPEAFIRAVEAITGKCVEVETWQMYVQGDDYIRIGEDDPEALLHELCHWIEADTIARAWPNLFLDDDPGETLAMLECDEVSQSGAMSLPSVGAQGGALGGPPQRLVPSQAAGQPADPKLSMGARGSGGVP